MPRAAALGGKGDRLRLAIRRPTAAAPRLSQARGRQRHRPSQRRSTRQQCVPQAKSTAPGHGLPRRASRARQRPRQPRTKALPVPPPPLPLLRRTVKKTRRCRRTIRRRRGAASLLRTHIAWRGATALKCCHVSALTRTPPRASTLSGSCPPFLPHEARRQPPRARHRRRARYPGRLRCGELDPPHSKHAHLLRPLLPGDLLPRLKVRP